MCSTPVRPLNSDFCITFGQLYDLHVYEWPRSISIKVKSYRYTCRSAVGSLNRQPYILYIQIFESEGIVWDEIATIYLPVPKVTQITTPGISNPEEIEFSSSATVAHSHGGVGAGISFCLQNFGASSIQISGVQINVGSEGLSSYILNTSGVLQCSALWGRAKDGTPLVPPPRSGADISE